MSRAQTSSLAGGSHTHNSCRHILPSLYTLTEISHYNSSTESKQPGALSALVGQLGRKGQHGNRGLNRSSRFESNNEHKHNSSDLEALRISLLVHYCCVRLRSHPASTTSAKEADGECSLAAGLVKVLERHRWHGFRLRSLQHRFRQRWSASKANSSLARNFLYTLYTHALSQYFHQFISTHHNTHFSNTECPVKIPTARGPSVLRQGKEVGEACSAVAPI
jgi:hypothetical protein